MPHFQKLYDRLKDRKDIAVITFNVDDNVGLVAPFLKQNNYTFPVIPAGFLVTSLVPSLSIPRHWIVDAAGVVRLERTGFGGDGAKWVEDMVEAIEKARTGR